MWSQVSVDPCVFGPGRVPLYEQKAPEGRRGTGIGHVIPLILINRQITHPQSISHTITLLHLPQELTEGNRHADPKTNPTPFHFKCICVCTSVHAHALGKDTAHTRRAVYR